MIAAAGRLLDGFAGFGSDFRFEIELLDGFSRIFRVRQIGRRKVPGQENPMIALMLSQPAKQPRSSGGAVGGGMNTPSARNYAANKLTKHQKSKESPLQNTA